MDDAAALAAALPGVTEGLSYGRRSWAVAGKGFVWERPLSKADIKRLAGQRLPQGPLLALHVEDLGEREAVLATNQAGFFTIAHFANYPAYLIELAEVDPDELREAILDAWLACAPPALAREYLAR